nr:MAG TPA: hypothetical protein [Caudoviricetes sp.]DAW17067.1 MAG TPA: hypothetical protein [Caudoviricetes sp.]
MSLLISGTERLSSVSPRPASSCITPPPKPARPSRSTAGM